jgi:glycosyltransferase involved in cell wall biosynthesis
MAAHITVLPRAATQRDVAAIMRDADCGVFPARGEGWNLDALEMLSCGRHVIATNHGGHTEFLNADNAFLIEIDALEPAADPEWMPQFSSRKAGEWAHLGPRQLDQLVEHLRAVHERTQCGDRSPNRAGIATAERFSWARTAEAVVAGMP